MLQPDTLRFLRELDMNNTRPWFEENKGAYQAAKEDVLSWAEVIYTDILFRHSKWTKAEVKNCLFRINRDVRFSKDKRPYKTHFGLLFAPEGKKGVGVGYYIQIEPGNKSFIAAGVWQPDGDMLKNIRSEIAYNSKTWLDIVENKKFKSAYGELESEAMLKKIPKGFEQDVQVSNYLRRKNFIASANIGDELLVSKKLSEQVKAQLAGLQEFVSFLETAVS